MHSTKTTILVFFCLRTWDWYVTITINRNMDKRQFQDETRPSTKGRGLQFLWTPFLVSRYQCKVAVSSPSRKLVERSFLLRSLVPGRNRNSGSVFWSAPTPAGKPVVKHQQDPTVTVWSGTRDYRLWARASVGLHIGSSSSRLSKCYVPHL